MVYCLYLFSFITLLLLLLLLLFSESCFDVDVFYNRPLLIFLVNKYIQYFPQKNKYIYNIVVQIFYRSCILIDLKKLLSIIGIK